jgi:Zn-dependent protease
MTSPDATSAPLSTLPPPLPPKAESLPANPAVIVCGLDSTKLTWGEWWRLGPGLTAVIGWCATILRTRILDAMRILVVQDSAALEISMEALSQEVRRKLLSQVDALRGLGFGDPRVMHVTDVFTNREIVLVVQLNASGTTLARTLYAYPLPGAITKKTTLSVGFLTAFADGGMLCTDAKRPKFLSSPRVLHRWKAGDLTARHTAHEHQIERAGDAVVIPSEKVFALCDAYENELISFGHSRGLLVPLSDAEGAKVIACTSPDEARHSAALAELVRLQTAKPRSMAGVVVLVVSLALFAGTGALRWSWEICAIIGSALFVHELGHYVAMRCFKYRDLHMFFIPLLGAAVTGKNHNVAGWKKAIVSLMGPLLGIVFGTGMAIAAVILGKPAIANAALIVIGLNLFNLLPILPLDGGWFWNAILFCRHRWLEAGFKSLAGVGLLTGTLAGAGGIWIVPGISMLRTVPRTLRLGTAAQRLRQRGWQPAAGDTISREAAETILAELKQTVKTPPAARTAAAEALNVFEHLNARPPSVLASFGLAASYAAAVLVALVGLGAAISADSGSRKKFSGAAPNSAIAQTTKLHAEFHGEIARIPATPESTEKIQSSRRLIATFPDAAAAAAGLEIIREEKIAVDQVVQFGQTLIAVTGFEDKATAGQVGERFRRSGGTVLDTGDRLAFVLLKLQFSVRDAETAARLSHDLQTYFTLPPDQRPPAPWMDDPAVAPQQREQYMKAAETYARVLAAQALTDESPELDSFRRVNFFTLFRSRKVARESAQEFAAKRAQLQREAVKRLRASGDPTLDPRILALVLRQPKMLATRAQLEAIEKWQDEMRELLTGCRDEDRTTSADRYLSAAVAVTDRRITLQFNSIPSPERTLPALAEYFRKFNCSDVRYGFYDVQILDAYRLAAMDR